MSAISDLVTSLIRNWNKSIKEAKYEYEVDLICKVRNKRFYIDKNNYIEKHIAELLFLQRKLDPSEKDFLLYREEIHIPPKEKHKSAIDLEIEYTTILYKAFLYECLGTFSLACKQLITSQDYAEYDIANDRIKQHESAKDMTIKALVGGKFYEAGVEFDVFLDDDTSENYAVYTAHEAGTANNGVAIVPKKDFMITSAKKASIILLS